MADVSAIELIDKSTTEIEDESANFEQQIHKEMQQDITWSQILGGSIGNILEWYDFATFGLS